MGEVSEPSQDLVAFVEQVEEFETADGPRTYVRLEAMSAELTERVLGDAGRDYEELRRLDTSVIDLIAEPKAVAATFGALPDEDAWLRVLLGPEGLPATQYRGAVFEQPAPTAVFVERVDAFPPDAAHALDGRLSPTPAPNASFLKAWRREAKRHVRHLGGWPRLLAALPVGQGSCALLAPAGLAPFLYFDFGAGCYANARTYEHALNLPFDESTLIVLSHWDADHWYLGRTTPAAQDHMWIVPRQRMGPEAARFAATLQARGRLFVLPDNIDRLHLGVAEVHRARGRGRNDSGLALDVTLPRNGGGAARVLVPGDARYAVVPEADHGWSGLIASHHGSKTGGDPPRPETGGYVAYSFGRENTYGHPHPARETADRELGWCNVAKTTDGAAVFCPRARDLCDRVFLALLLAGEKIPGPHGRFHRMPGPTAWQRLMADDDDDACCCGGRPT